MAQCCHLLRRVVGQGASIDAAFLDPPYNVKINGHANAKGRHREFVMASGEMSEAAFRTFLAETLGAAAAVSRAGAVHFICMDWRHLDDASAAGGSIYGDLLNICVWNKSNAGMGSLYRSKHEMVFVYRVGDAPHANMVELGWGNDPGNFAGGPLTQTWLNPAVHMPHVGYQGPLNGPVDNAASSCLSCHSTAETPMGQMTGSDADRWFRNLPSGTPFDAGRQSFDYSLQLAVGLNNFQTQQSLNRAAPALRHQLFNQMKNIPQAPPRDGGLRH